MALLTPAEIQSRLGALPGWQYRDAALTREYVCESFAAALLLVNAVGYAAERADHHPDIDLRYRRVRITLTTHSQQGVTEKDFALAETIEQLQGR